MTKITLNGVDHDIPVFKLRELKAAAPYIDKVLKRRREMSSLMGATDAETSNNLAGQDDILASMMSSLNDVISVIAIGVIKGRQEYPYTVAKIAAVAEEIEADCSMDEVNALNPVFDAILRDSGMSKSDPSPMTGASGEQSSLSPIASTESLQSSSQQDAPEAIGTV